MSRTRLVAVLGACLLSMVVSLVVAVPAQAKGGTVGGQGNQYFLANTFSGSSDVKFTYGRTADEVYVGDWDGNGTDTLAVRRGATFYISNSFSSTKADKVITYGRAGDVVLVGDWNGDGKDTFAVRRGSEYFIKNSMSGGKADKVIVYGHASDVVLVGDWNGDRKDTFAVRRGTQYFLKNSMSGGAADLVVTYGKSSDTALVGDWNGDDVDTLGLRRYVVPPPAGERTYRGTGDDVVDISTNGQPVILTITCDNCQHNFIVTSNGDDYLLVNVIGPYSGRHVIDMMGRTTQLIVQADSSWQIVQDPLSIMYTDTHRSGHGDDVVYLPSGDRARFTHDGQHNFIVIAYDPGWDLLVNEIGPYAGTVPFTAPAVVQIEADGNWTVSPSY